MSQGLMRAGAGGASPSAAVLTSAAVLSAGSWGTTFAKVLADANPQTPVRLWARRAELVEEINTRHLNTRYLPEIPLPGNISAGQDPARVLAGAELVVLAIPAQSLRAQLRQWRDLIAPGAVVISLMKGLELGSDARMSEVIAEELSLREEQIVVISGPNLALEIARQEPTASVVACADESIAAWVARFSAPGYFRPYTTTDVTGVEIGGIVKNVIALAVGVCDGKAMGQNTRASVITRGLAETTRLAVALGGQPETMAGLAGLGDLVATCSSPLSRNRTAGRLLGQGLSLEQVAAEMTQTAEGIKSAPAVHELAGKLGVEMPITAAMVGVLSGRLTVDELGPRLLARDLKAESEYS